MAPVITTWSRSAGILAAQGYYAEMIEYYAPGEEVVPGEHEKIRQSFVGWVKKLHDGWARLARTRRSIPSVSV